MEKMEKVVLELQNKALVAVYMEMRLNHSMCDRARGYMEAIEVINKEYKTNYESFGLEAIAQKTENMRETILKMPLVRK
jgi:hypothetical protein